MIRLTSLSCSYGKKAKPVLRDVSFTLNKGEIAILLGPNGAGKSTLLQAVLGNIKFYEGDILIDGKNIKELSARQRAKLIAYVPQSFHFAPSSVYDAILLGRIPYFAFAPSQEDHAYVNQIIQEMGLETLASRNVTELSGGEKQKVAIARALAQGSEILVLDEPTSNLDLAAQAQIASLIKGLAKRKNLTILMSIHDLNLALNIGKSFIFLKNGFLIGQKQASQIDEDLISSVFDIEAKKIKQDDHEYFIFGGHGS